MSCNVPQMLALFLDAEVLCGHFPSLSVHCNFACIAKLLAVEFLAHNRAVCCLATAYTKLRVVIPRCKPQARKLALKSYVVPPA